MKIEAKTTIEKDMDETILVSKKIREELMSLANKDDISGKALQVYRIALDANKNIVSASCVKVAIEKLK